MKAQENTIISSGVLSLLPLYYVGWSDSVLSPSELKFIHEKIESYSFLTEEDKIYLKKWADPLNPPSEKLFKIWGQEIKKHSIDLNNNQKASLIQLGLEMAQKATSQSDERWSSSETKKSILEFKDVLGITDESEQLLINKLFPEIELQDDCSTCQFESNDLKEILDIPHADLKNRIRRLLCDPFFDQTFEPNKEKNRERVLQQIKKLADQGLSSYSFPKKYGGFEKNGDHIAVFEMLGYADLSLAIKFGVQFGLFGGAVYQLGTEKHHIKYVEALHKAELLGCFAMTETGHGSNVKNLETTATYNHEDKTITVNSPNFSAGKEYIGNALHSEMAAVFTQLIVDGENHGVHAVLVPLRKDNNVLPGIKVEDCGYKMGLNGVDNGRIWFDNVKVPVDNLLNKYGSIDEKGQYSSPIENPSKRFFTMLGALVVGRICVGLLGNNASKLALTIALKYSLKRRQFASKDGQKETLLIDYPTHQKRLFPLLAKTYGHYFALRDLAEQYANSKGDDTREIETLAAGLKSKATWLATETIQICREACGGKGYLMENKFALLKADSDIFTTFEGDNTVLMQLVSKGLLTEFKQSFHNDGYKAVIRFLFTKVKHEALEYNPIFTRNTDAKHILDRRFHKHAFNYRYKKTLISLSDRMRKYLKRGIDPHQAFLKVQNHMVDLADAFIDNVILNSFYKRVDECGNENLKIALEKMTQLYALTVIQDNRAYYLEKDYMDGSKTKAINRVINKLFQNIKPDINSFLDAFGIPDELIMAPIAKKEFS